MARILVAIRVIPVGTPTPSISNYVAKVVGIIERKKLKYQITPFNTAFEVNTLEELRDVLDDIIKSLSEMDVKRIAIDLQLDIRFDKEITLNYKVDSVLRRLRNQ